MPPSQRARAKTSRTTASAEKTPEATSRTTAAERREDSRGGEQPRLFARRTPRGIPRSVSPRRPSAPPRRRAPRKRKRSRRRRRRSTHLAAPLRAKPNAEPEPEPRRVEFRSATPAAAGADDFERGRGLGRRASLRDTRRHGRRRHHVSGRAPTPVRGGALGAESRPKRWTRRSRGRGGVGGLRRGRRRRRRRRPSPRALTHGLDPLADVHGRSENVEKPPSPARRSPPASHPPPPSCPPPRGPSAAREASPSPAPRGVPVSTRRSPSPPPARPSPSPARSRPVRRRSPRLARRSANPDPFELVMDGGEPSVDVELLLPPGGALHPLVDAKDADDSKVDDRSPRRRSPRASPRRHLPSSLPRTAI